MNEEYYKELKVKLIITEKEKIFVTGSALMS